MDIILFNAMLSRIQNEILENSEEKVIDVVLEKIGDNFSTIYTEEEKRVLIMIILEKYEQSLYNE